MRPTTSFHVVAPHYSQRGYESALLLVSLYNNVSWGCKFFSLLPVFALSSTDRQASWDSTSCFNVTGRSEFQRTMWQTDRDILAGTRMDKKGKSRRLPAEGRLWERKDRRWTELVPRLAHSFFSFCTSRKPSKFEGRTLPDQLWYHYSAICLLLQHCTVFGDAKTHRVASVPNNAVKGEGGPSRAREVVTGVVRIMYNKVPTSASYIGTSWKMATTTTPVWHRYESYNGRSRYETRKNTRFFESSAT